MARNIIRSDSDPDPSADSPWLPAHAAPDVVGIDGVRVLSDRAAILERYRRGGPHVTVIMPIPTPGRPGDDLAQRWSATRTDLRRRHAPDAALTHLDRLVDVLPRSGRDAVLTADTDDAAYCWLTSSAGPAVAKVAALPALTLALAEIDRRPRVVAAAVDRIGADLYVVDHAQIEARGAVDGEQEGIHKSAGDGADQARNQRHSEVLWDRNAQDVATELLALLPDGHDAVVVLSGDRRATDLVEHHLLARPGTVVHQVRAGSRHEPDTARRLLAAAIATAATARDDAHRLDTARLAEELGQQDRAVDGEVRTLQAVAEARVKTLFVDTTRWDEHPHVDQLILAAADTGADVVATALPALADGVGALLRRPYPATSPNPREASDH